MLENDQDQIFLVWESKPYKWRYIEYHRTNIGLIHHNKVLDVSIVHHHKYNQEKKLDQKVRSASHTIKINDQQNEIAEKMIDDFASNPEAFRYDDETSYLFLLGWNSE